MANGQRRGKQNLDALNRWIEQREVQADWGDYIRRGKLNRSEIAIECGFARSVIGSNPAIKARLRDVERLLAERGLLAASSFATLHSDDVEQDKTVREIDKRDRRIAALEARVATQRAEIIALRDKLKQATAIQDELVPTGRRFRPGPYVSSIIGSGT